MTFYQLSDASDLSMDYGFDWSPTAVPQNNEWNFAPSTTMPLENFSSQSSIIYDEVFESYPQSYHPAIYEEKRKEPVIGETKRRTEKRKKQNRDSQRLFRQRQKKKIEALVAQLDNMRNENSCLLEKCEKLTSLVTDRMQDVDENSAHSSIECTESGSCSDQKQKLISKTEIEAWHLDGEYEFP